MPLFGGIPKASHAGIFLQQPERESMKRHDVEAGRRRQFQQPCDAATHFVGRFLGEGHGEDPRRVDALPDKMNETARQRAGLAGTWPAKVS